MAKHPRKRRGRRFRRYIKGNIDVDMALGTLAAQTLVAQAVADTVDERTFVSSAKLNWAMGDFTPIANSGPIRVGLAHSDYTAAEIEEWVELTTGWSEGDLVSQEISNRRIREVGVFPTSPGGASTGNSVLNDGKPITTKLGWILLGGQTLDVWAYNAGSAAVATTDPNMHAVGHANLWPQ